MLDKANVRSRAAPPLVRGAVPQGSEPGGLFPPLVVPIAIGLLLLGLTGSNVVLAMGSVALLLAGSWLLWRPSEPPVLLFVFGYQWLQISIGIFYAASMGITLNEFAMLPGLDIETTATVSLVGLLLFACGMRLGTGAYRREDGELARLVARSNPVRSWFWLYGAALLAASISQSMAWIIPGLSQPLLAVGNLKWGFFLMLTYATFCQDGNRSYWLTAFAIEFVLSIGGYFSDFKTVFLFSLFGVVGARARFSFQTYLMVVVLTAFMLVFGVIWTAIKPTYRNFISGGQAAQVVVVPFDERIVKLADLVFSVDGKTFGDGVDALVRRIGYLDFFAAVIDYVPQQVPHEGGALWLDAVSRPFMPRLFFPDKKIIDDSERTNKYTGLGVAGADAGTSISIGYMGETYIDFGFIGMMPVLFLFGLFLGFIYRYMLRSKFSRGVLGMGMASAIVYSAAPFETSITKSVGGLMVALLVGFLVIRVVIPRYAPWARAL